MKNIRLLITFFVMLGIAGGAFAREFSSEKTSADLQRIFFSKQKEPDSFLFLPLDVQEKFSSLLERASSSLEKHDLTPGSLGMVLFYEMRYQQYLAKRRDLLPEEEWAIYYAVSYLLPEKYNHTAFFAISENSFEGFNWELYRVEKMPMLIELCDALGVIATSSEEIEFWFKRAGFAETQKEWFGDSSLQTPRKLTAPERAEFKDTLQRALNVVEKSGRNPKLLSKAIYFHLISNRYLSFSSQRERAVLYALNELLGPLAHVSRKSYLQIPVLDLALYHQECAMAMHHVYDAVKEISENKNDFASWWTMAVESEKVE